MREKYESLSVSVLKEVAKARGLKHLSGLKKGELVELMLKEDAKPAAVENGAERKSSSRTAGDPAGALRKERKEGSQNGGGPAGTLRRERK